MIRKWVRSRQSVRSLLLAGAALVLALTASPARAQNWVWKTEPVDKSGTFTSLAADPLGNLHISYISSQAGVKYGFRQAGSGRWFTMALGKAEDGFTRLALDGQGNPSICYTAYGSLHFARFQDGQWNTQEVAPGSGPISFSCSVAIGHDGTPHLAWYQYSDKDRSPYLHLKYAALKDGIWVARTLDFDGETGKWNSMVLDARGNPHISYSAWRRGDLKYAHWNGKTWVVYAVDSRSFSNSEAIRGMGNSIVIAPDGTPEISYYEELTLKFARLEGNVWKKETLDTLAPAVGVSWLGLRSTLVLDRGGMPHIVYGDFGALKHAYWDGSKWRVQVIESSGAGTYRHTSATIDANDILYASYQDPSDDSLKVAIGRLAASPQTAAAVAGNKD